MFILIYYVLHYNISKVLFVITFVDVFYQLYKIML